MSEERESTIWEHIEELSMRLKRILVALGLAAVILSALPLEAVQPLLGLLHPHHGSTVNVTVEKLPTGLLECRVKSVKVNGSIVDYELICRAKHNSTAGGASLSLLPIHISYTPLIVKVPEAIISIIVPKQVVAAGRVYHVVIMPTDAFESFEIILLSALLLGFIAASPIIIREVWAYVEPALYPHEKMLIKRYGAAFFTLFLAGVLLAIFIIAPLTYRVTLSMYPFFVPPDYGVLIRVSVSEVIKFTVELAIASGLVFEVPLVLYILIVHGVIEPEKIESNLKYVFLGAMILGAMISPDPSGLGMVILGLTLYTPIHVAVKLAKKKVREKEARGTTEAQAYTSISGSASTTE